MQPGGGVKRRGQFALQHDALALALGIGLRRRRQQRPRIGMLRIGEDVLARALFDDAAEIHDHHVIGDMAHDRQIVADEEIGEIEPLLDVGEEVQHLRLDRHIERRDRLVEHQDGRRQHQRAGDGDALALAAREHVRIAVVMLGPQADIGHHFARPLGALGGGSAWY